MYEPTLFVEGWSFRRYVLAFLDAILLSTAAFPKEIRERIIRTGGSVSEPDEFWELILEMRREHGWKGWTDWFSHHNLTGSPREFIWSCTAPSQGERTRIFLEQYQGFWRIRVTGEIESLRVARIDRAAYRDY
jgi:hypothetical protein